FLVMAKTTTKKKAGSPPPPPGRKLARRSRWLLVLPALALLAAVVAFEGRAHLRALDRKEALRLCHQGRFPDAEPMLKNALEWEANDLEVIQALAQGYVGTGQVNEADTFLSRWCVLQPAEVQPHLLRLQLLPKIGKLTEAVAEAEQVLAVQPDNQ